MSPEDVLEFAVESVLAVEERPSRWLEERVDDTLSVLGPTGFLLLLRSRVITISCGPSSC
jgi:hypothetical protein